MRPPERPHAPPCVQHPPLRYKCCASTAPAAHTLTLLSQEQSQKHLMLCKLKNDSDWAENGEIIKKEQMQSEYWVSDSLLISVHNSSPAGGAPGPVACELCVVRAGYGLSQVDIYVDICARCCGVWGVAVVCVMLCGVYACVGVGVGGGGGPAHGHSLRSASLSLSALL